MVQYAVRVRAASRLHFGMLSFGDPSVRQYGGVGVMIETPGINLTISPHHQRLIEGPHRERVAEFMQRWSRHRGRAAPPPCRVQVAAAPRQHIGLGTGTQLALAVAAGLDACLGLPHASASDLARSVGRGQRSAVGTHGFRHGGLIAELGRWEDQTLAPLERHVALPAAWRFVLLIPTDQVGLSGAVEQQAFESLAPVSREAHQWLLHELRDRLIPSAQQADFDQFGESVYQYGVTAGRCFAQRQAGAFATRQLAEWVKMIRQMGVRGVGQSSWGPTLFALLPDEDEAARFTGRLRQRLDTRRLRIVITPVCNRGAACTRQHVAD